MKTHSAWLAIGLLLFVVLACEYSSSSSGAISEGHMAKDNGSGAPGDETNTFNPEDRNVHCLVKLKNPKEGIRIKFSWWIVDAGGSKNEKLKEIDYTTESSDNMVHGNLSVQRDWPEGKYKVDVYVDGNLAKTLTFNVQ